MVYICGNPKFNSIAAANKRNFNNEEEMNNYLIKQWNEVITEHDITYVLGEFSNSYKDNLKDIVSKLNGEIVLVGNYNDYQKRKWTKIGIETIFTCDLFLPYKEDDKLYFTNEDREGYSDFKYFCYVGKDEPFSSKTLCIDLDFWNYQPLSVEKIPEIYDNMKTFCDLEELND